MNLPSTIKFGGMKTGHIQGIATDRERKYMYYSFTTSFVKTDMEGNVVGTVDGLCGHLGCIAYNYGDGKVYGSLEFKHDSIGKGVLDIVNGGESRDIDVVDGFYIVSFDVNKIDRVGMHAERDGIMNAIFLPEVVKDYTAEGHRYGCSGIDGITVAPEPAKEGESFLYVAYGIYLDLDREDNDRQIILRYSLEDFNKYAMPLKQQSMHRSGPDAPLSKYFLYTGNTRWGVQNLEYDPENRLMLVAVYPGSKKSFPNYPMFFIDMNEKPKTVCGEEHLTLAAIGECDVNTGIHGSRFPLGSTGVISLGNGYFYFSEPSTNDSGWNTVIRLYRFDGRGNFTEIQ